MKDHRQQDISLPLVDSRQKDADDKQWQERLEVKVYDSKQRATDNLGVKDTGFCFKKAVNGSAKNGLFDYRRQYHRENDKKH